MTPCLYNDGKGSYCLALWKEGHKSMGVKAGWENSTKSPDWIDVEGYLRAIGALHSGHVVCRVSPLGTGFLGGLDVTVSMGFDVLPGSRLPKEVSVSRGWPCNEHATLPAHVLACLYELDFKVGQVYNQASLWE